MRTPTIIPYAGILCCIHGNVDIDYKNYIDQMARPNSKWVCPKCGAVSEFDDDRYEELNPQED